MALGGPKRIKTCKGSPMAALGCLAGLRRVKEAQDGLRGVKAG